MIFFGALGNENADKPSGYERQTEKVGKFQQRIGHGCCPTAAAKGFARLPAMCRPSGMLRPINVMLIAPATSSIA